MHDRPYPDRDRYSAQVLRFQLRPRAGGAPLAGSTGEPNLGDDDLPDDLPDDLAQYQQDSPEDEPINYRQRMLMNVIALAVVTGLIGAGVWIADTIGALERDQDCVLQGRQNCAPIETPVHKDLQ